MTKDPILYINHILDVISSIETQLNCITRKQFDQSEMIQGFVERKLEIIVEATKNIQDEFKKQYSDVPWKEMAGMRDILIHQYTAIDEDIVWKTATLKTLPLKKQIEKILQEISAVKK